MAFNFTSIATSANKDKNNKDKDSASDKNNNTNSASKNTNNNTSASKNNTSKNNKSDKNNNTTDDLPTTPSKHLHYDTTITPIKNSACAVVTPNQILLTPSIATPTPSSTPKPSSPSLPVSPLLLTIDKQLSVFPKSIGKENIIFININNMMKYKIGCGEYIKICKYNKEDELNNNISIINENKIINENDINDITLQLQSISINNESNYIIGRVWPLEKVNINNIRMSIHGNIPNWLKVDELVLIDKIDTPIIKAKTVLVELKNKNNENIVEITPNLSSLIISSLQLCIITSKLKLNCLNNVNSYIEINLIDDTVNNLIYQVTEETKIAFATPEVIVKKSFSFDNIGGLKSQIKTIRECIEMPLLSPELFEKYGIKPTKGVLLFGPPGTGKTMIAKALCATTKAKFFNVNGSQIVSKYVGESEAKLNSIFEEASRASPSIIFIDEIDSLCPKRQDASDDMQKRLVATLLTLIDGMSSSSKVIILAATNLPNSIDAALRRPGRFDREIEIGIPTLPDRLEILKLCLKNTSHNMCEDELSQVNSNLHGYVGADIQSLCREASLLALKRNTTVTHTDLKAALAIIQPSAMREVSIEIPKVYWSAIGGQQEIKTRLQEAVEWPLLHPETFQRLGITPPKGILLYGPPGCSKTLMAKALATECSRNFIAVKGPELFSKYVGDSEKAIREVFRKARAAAPSIIFFDEIDSIAVQRGRSDGDRVGDRVLNQLLTEMDGFQPLQQVTILAATNRPDIIDVALLRPGRFDRVLYVGPPDHPSREEIFKIELRKIPNEDVNVTILADKTEKYSGAEISAVCRRAAYLAMEENIEIRSVFQRHFEKAIEQTPARITEDMIKFYEDYKSKSVSKAI